MDSFWDGEDQSELYSGRINGWMQVGVNDMGTGNKAARIGKTHVEMHNGSPSWGYHGGGGSYHHWFVWILPPYMSRVHNNNWKNSYGNWNSWGQSYSNSYFSQVVEKHIQFRHEIPSTSETESLFNSWEEKLGQLTELSVEWHMNMS